MRRVISLARIAMRPSTWVTRQECGSHPRGNYPSSKCSAFSIR